MGNSVKSSLVQNKIDAKAKFLREKEQNCSLIYMVGCTKYGVRGEGRGNLRLRHRAEVL